MNTVKCAEADSNVSFKCFNLWVTFTFSCFGSTGNSLNFSKEKFHQKNFCTCIFSKVVSTLDQRSTDPGLKSQFICYKNLCQIHQGFALIVAGFGVHFTHNRSALNIGGSKGALGTPFPLSVQFFFIFMKFSAKFLPNNRLTPLQGWRLLGNPGYATVQFNKIVTCGNFFAW